MSLIPIGIPCSGPRSFPAASSSSRSFACSTAPVAVDDHPGATRRLPLVDLRQARFEHVEARPPLLSEGAADTLDRLVIGRKQVHDDLRRLLLPLEHALRDVLDALLGELLEELGAAVEVELADERGLHAAVAPRLAPGEVLGEGVARDVRQVGHRDPLHRPARRVADQRRLEQAGDQRRRRLHQPELQQHLDHLRADHPDVRRVDLDAVHRRQLARSSGTAPRHWPGSRAAGSGLAKTVARGDPLELVDHLLRPAVPLVGQLLLRRLADQVGAEEQVPARRSSPSRRRMAAMRSCKAPRSGGSTSRTVWVEPSGLVTRTGRRPGGRRRRRRRPRRGRSPPAARGASPGSRRGRPWVKRSCLFRTTIDRFPCLASAAGARTRSGSGRDRRRTGAGRPARRGRAPRASRMRPAVADLGEARRVGQEDGPVDALDGVRVRPRRAGWSPSRPRSCRRSRPSRALISEVFPAEPVPKTTTWNRRRSRSARSVGELGVEPGLGPIRP